MKRQAMSFLYASLILMSMFSCSSKTTPPVSKVSPISEEKLGDKNVTTSVDFKMTPARLRMLIDTIDREILIKDHRNEIKLYSQLLKFYQLNDYELFWSGQESLKKHFDHLMNQLRQAPEHGLNPDDYAIEKLEYWKDRSESQPLNPISRAYLDLYASTAYISFAWHLRNGKYSPPVNKKYWLKDKAEENIAHLIVRGDIKKALKKVMPESENYKSTVKAIKKYQAIHNQGGWPTNLPGDLSIKKGNSNPHIPEVIDRLKATEDLSKDYSTDSTVMDKSIEQAVMNFQKRHGLNVDGIIGGETVRAMNISSEKKLEKLAINLERMRWMPESLGNNYVLINIPDYKLSVIEDEELKLSMSIVLGEEATQTPLFNDTLEYIVFSPTWTIPPSIIAKEIAPDVARNPNYLKNNNYKLYLSWNEDAKPIHPDSTSIDWKDLKEEDVNFRIVQPPGPENALGRVKFIMPNEERIYLHDTPAKHLFHKHERAYSHGCIRIEKPVDFAAYLLQDREGWDSEKIKEYMQKDEPHRIPLTEDLPVFIIYRTAWAEDGGQIVHFRKDIYNYDEKLFKYI